LEVVKNENINIGDSVPVVRLGRELLGRVFSGKLMFR
jgi:hypothetical protein